MERLLGAGAAHSNAADQDGNLPMHYAAIAVEDDGSSSEVEVDLDGAGSSGRGGGLLGCCRRRTAYAQGRREGARSRVAQVGRAAAGAAGQGARCQRLPARSPAPARCAALRPTAALPRAVGLYQGGAGLCSSCGQRQRPAGRCLPLQVIALLVEAGADVNARNSSSRTPLMQVGGRAGSAGGWRAPCSWGPRS